MILHFNRWVFNANFTVSTSGNSGMTSNQFKNLRDILPAKKNKVVKKVFSEVSESYDIMNDLMSLGLHRVWKNQMLNFVSAKKKDVFMDLAGGSGDLSLLIKKKYPGNKCTLVDSNQNMIDQAKKKLKNLSIKFVLCESEKMPFKSQSFNHILLAFGIRNFSDMKKSLSEIYRTLAPNGTFICLEFSHVNNKIIKDITNLYYNAIPKIGKIVANNEEAYKYLIESIKVFPNQMEFTKILSGSGFKDIECFDILDGIASIHIGVKK